MNLLLDTCTFLWILEGSEKLSEKCKKIFIDPENEIYLSTISAWEIMAKYQLGKLPLPASPFLFVTKQRENHGIKSLPLDESSIWQLEKLPMHHKDPFDRMLIAQAISHSLAILTPDHMITQYPIKTFW